MSTPIGLQLYSVRDALEKDYEGVIRKIAAMGYEGVETAGFPGTTPAAAANLFQSLNLKVAAAHSGLPLGDNKGAVLDTMAALGAKTVICAWLDPQKYFEAEDGIKAAADLLNEGNAVCRANGLTLAYHNHWFEYAQINGHYAADLLRERLDSDVQFEIDTYWVRVAGADPAQVIRQLGARAPYLHIKDGPLVREEPMVAVGEGKMDFGPILNAAQGNVKWLIVELDRCATDMLEAVQKSLKNLKAKVQ